MNQTRLVPESEDDERLEDLVAEAEDWPLPGPSAQPSPQNTLIPTLSYTNQAGAPMKVVPETAAELSLLERFAAYDREIIGRLMAFETNRRGLDVYLNALDQPATTRPDVYDDLLKKLLRRV